MTSRTVVQVARPADVLLQQCEAAVRKPTLKVGDIQENRIRAVVAFEKCAARVRCLIWWITTANHETPPVECSTGTREKNP